MHTACISLSVKEPLAIQCLHRLLRGWGAKSNIFSVAIGLCRCVLGTRGIAAFPQTTPTFTTCVLCGACRSGPAYSKATSLTGTSRHAHNIHGTGHGYWYIIYRSPLYRKFIFWPCSSFAPHACHPHWQNYMQVYLKMSKVLVKQNIPHRAVVFAFVWLVMQINIPKDRERLLLGKLFHQRPGMVF